MQWAKSATLVGIGLTEIPKSGKARAHPAHPLTVSLHSEDRSRDGTQLAQVNEERRENAMIVTTMHIIVRWVMEFLTRGYKIS